MNVDLLPSLHKKDCTDCKLHEGRNSIISSYLPKDAEILIISDAPGETEDNTGTYPHVGKAGKLLKDALIQAKFDPNSSKIAYAYSVRCFPRETNVKKVSDTKKVNRPVKDSEIKVCTKYLRQEIESLSNLKLIVGMGAGTARFLLQDSKLKLDSVFNKVLHTEFGNVLITHNPRRLLYAPDPRELLKIKTEVIKTFKLAKAIISGDTEPIERADYKHYVALNMNQVDWVCNQLQKSSIFSYDLETSSLDYLTSKILSISFSWKEKVAATIPFYKQHLVPIWTKSEEEVIWEKLKNILEDNNLKKVAQNGKFDNQHLLTRGIHVQGFEGDTLLMSYSVNENSDHDLKSLAWVYTDLGGYDSKLENLRIEWAKKLGVSKKELSYADLPHEDLWEYACLESSTPVLLEDGSILPISTIVNNRLQVKVLSYNFKTGKLEGKKVINWFKNRRKIEKLNSPVHGSQLKNDWYVVKSDYKSQGKVYCSPDHPFFNISGEKIPASMLKKGDCVVIKESSLTNHQREAILGSLLGDSHLHKARGGAKNSLNFRTSHCEAQKLYVEALHSLLYSFGVSPIQKVKQRDLISHKILPKVFQYVFSTRSSTIVFNSIYTKLYKGGKKRISRDYLDDLSNISLAYWYMDDGSISGGTMFHLATEGFDKRSVQEICKWFYRRYKILPAIRRNRRVKNGSGLALAFNVKDSKILFSAIAPYIIPCMQYKLPVEYRDKYCSNMLDKTSPQISILPLTEVRPYRRGKEKGGYGGIRKKLNNVYYDIEVEDNHNFFANKILVGNCTDADVTLRIYNILIKEIAKQDLAEYFYSYQMPMSKFLTRMEYYGVRIDQDMLNSTITKFKQQIDELDIQILSNSDVQRYIQLKRGQYYKVRGDKWRKSKNLQSRHTFDEYINIKADSITFNSKSPKQLKELFIDLLKQKVVKKTSKGNPAFDREALEIYSHKLPIAKVLSARNKLMTMLSTFLEGMKRNIRVDGNLHSSFNLHVANTGRLSSSNVNLQNVPNKTNNPVAAKFIRDIFIADEGCMFIDADFKQNEFRMWGQLSGDPVLLQDLESGIDIHKKIAALGFGVTEDEITPVMRSIAKTIVFGNMYGRSVKSVAKQLGVSEAQAKRIQDALFNRYKIAARWITTTKKLAIKDKQVRGIFGQIRHLQGLVDSHIEDVRGKALRQSVNAPIQGSASQLNCFAAMKIQETFDREQIPQGRVVLMVHDSILCNVRKDYLERGKQIVKECMLNPHPAITIPLGVDIDTGFRWGDAIELPEDSNIEGSLVDLEVVDEDEEIEEDREEEKDKGEEENKIVSRGLKYHVWKQVEPDGSNDNPIWYEPVGSRKGDKYTVLIKANLSLSEAKKVCEKLNNNRNETLYVVYVHPESDCVWKEVMDLNNIQELSYLGNDGVELVGQGLTEEEAELEIERITKLWDKEG